AGLTELSNFGKFASGERVSWGRDELSKWQGVREISRSVRGIGRTPRRTIAYLTFRAGKGTIDGRSHLPARVWPPWIPDGRGRGLRLDPGGPVPGQGPRRAEELCPDRGEGRFDHPYLSARRDGAPGVVRSQAPGADRVPGRDEVDPHQDRRRAVL